MTKLSLTLILLAATRSGWCYEDGAPPGHTGGFGEPDCSFCHSDSDANSADGTLNIEGLPDRYLPGQTYDFAVFLTHPELKSGGFQLALRSADGRPAGELASLSPRTRIVAAAGLSYLQHSSEGREPANDQGIRWLVRWIAPSGNAPIRLHVAANAANDDASALGDYIFTVERVIEPAIE